MKYRSRTEIVAMILEAANGGATKTRIMYKAFLSYAQLREYLQAVPVLARPAVPDRQSARACVRPATRLRSLPSAQRRD